MKKTDDKRPTALLVEIKDTNGKIWGVLTASQKDFSTGSTGFYANGKISNPDNPSANYQTGLTFTLIGSKG